MSTTFRFPFFTLSLDGPDDPVAGLTGPLGELCCLPAAEPLPPEAFRCRLTGLETDQTGTWHPLFPDDEARLGADPERGVYRVTADRSWALVDPGAGEARIGLDMAGWPKLPNWRTRRFLVDLIQALLAGRPCYTLHAALLTREGAGLLVTGPPGAGKTTFSLSLIAEGWQLLTDDVTLVRHLGRESLASGLRRLVHLAPDTAARYPDLVARRLGVMNITGEKEGAELVATDHPDPALVEVPIRKILFMERKGEGHTAWEPMLPREAIPVLWQRLFALNADRDGRWSFETLAGLVRGAALARVLGGEDLVEDRATAGKIVEEI